MANRIRITNLVSQHKKMAEGFLQQLIDAEAIPKNFSGVITPKFGNMIFTWQFQKNKLVGSVVINVKNVNNYRAKLSASASGMDFLVPNAPMVKEKEEVIG